jgi:hypothetical protein
MNDLTGRDELLFNIEGRINRHGWSCYYIFGGPGPPWLYTIGLVERFHHAELILFGLDQGSAHGAVTRAIERIESGAELRFGREAGERLDDIPVAFLKVEDTYWREPSDYFLGWLDYYGAVERTPERRAIQLVWSDEDGRFPWQKGFSPPLLRLQPLLDRMPA